MSKEQTSRQAKSSKTVSRSRCPYQPDFPRHSVSPSHSSSHHSDATSSLATIPSTTPTSCIALTQDASSTLISRTHCHATDCFSEHLGFGRGSSYEEPPGGGLQLRNRLHSSESSDGVTHKDPSDLPKSFTTHSEPAFVRGLDRKGRPSLDAWSSWALSASFTPASNTAFLKLRTSLELRTSDTNQYLYIFVPPERIESLTIEVFDRAVHLRLALVQHGDLVGPVPLPAPTTGVGERTLSSARWLAARPALAIELLHSRVSADRWQHFGRACNEGLLKSDPNHVDLNPLYGGKGGHLIEAYQEIESPPAYNDLVDPTPDVAQPSRKRQRSSPTPCPDAMGKGFESYVWKVCSDIVERQRDEMIAPFLSRMEEMEDRITSRVIDHVESTLDKQLRELRDDLDGELEGDLDDRVDAVREEMKEYVEHQVKEQMAEQVASLEEDFVDEIMDRIEGR